LAGDVIHEDDEFRYVSAEVHCTAHAAGRHVRRPPVGQVTGCGDLQTSQNHDVEMSATRHGERGKAIEYRAAWQHRYRLALSVVVVPAVLILARLRSVAQDAVLRVQLDTRIGADVVGDFRRNAHPEVDVLTWFEQLRGAQRHLILVQAERFGSGDLTPTSALPLFGVELLVATSVVEHQAIDVNAGDRDVFCGDGADRNNFVHLGDGDSACRGHDRMKVGGRPDTCQVAEQV